MKERDRFKKLGETKSRFSLKARLTILVGVVFFGSILTAWGLRE